MERETGPTGEVRTTVRHTDELELESIEIPGDLSSAAFLIAAGVLVRGSRLLIEVHEAWEKAQLAAQEALGRRTFAQLRNALPSPLKDHR